MKLKSEKPGLTVFERFQEENERILKEAAEIDRAMKAKQSDYEKKLEEASARLNKATSIRDQMRADFEQIEAERQGTGDLANKRKDILAGSVSLGDYCQAAGETATGARANTTRLNDLLAVVRAKDLEILQIEVEVAECEREILFLQSYAAAALLERLRGNVKELEAQLTPGMLSGNFTKLDQKKQALALANGRSLSGEAWHDLKIEAVKRLRFQAKIPDAELSALNRIISEMEQAARIHGLDSVYCDGTSKGP